MKQYIDTIKLVLEDGSLQDNRTGIRTITYPGVTMRHDLQKGFPILTSKKVAYKSAIAEMIGFIRGFTSAEEFRGLGTNVWDKNANENLDWLNNPFRSGVDDNGPIYGAIWRSWEAFKLLPVEAQNENVDAKYQRSIQFGYENFGHITLRGKDGKLSWNMLLRKRVDQLAECVDKLINNPADRRILFHGWNPAKLDEISLPACHLLYQFLPNVQKRELSLSVYLRSWDLGLGCPFNLIGAGLLLSFISKITGFTPRFIIMYAGDAHIYENHVEMLTRQINNFETTEYKLPTLEISDELNNINSAREAISWLDRITPELFTINDYQCHEPIKMEMAV